MFEVRDTIHAPQHAVWQLLTDTHAWSRWGPSVRAVDCPTRFISAGARGRVKTAVGLWLPFVVTGWKAGQFWCWCVAGVPATGHRVAPVAANSCEVTFTVPVWAPFYLPVCRAAIRRIDLLACRTPGPVA